MQSEQYEELCRRFIAEQTGVAITAVQSVSVPNPTRPGLPEYRHQIDLYWETGNVVASYLNIANAKWRGTDRVDQGDVLLLQQVRQQVAAHKAFMITNVGFTRGAVAAAKDHGIALHVVKPVFEVSNLPRSDRAAIQGALAAERERTRRPLYSLHIEHRGLGFDAHQADDQVAGSSPAPARFGYETRVVHPHGGPPSGAPNDRSIVPSETRSSFNPGLRTRDGGGFSKKG